MGFYFVLKCDSIPSYLQVRQAKEIHLSGRISKMFSEHLA